MKLWIVAQVKSNEPRVWELGGVFSSEDKARAVCNKTSDCLFAVELDELLSRETVDVGVYPAQGG